LNLNQKLAVLLMPKPQAKRINLRKIKLLFRIYSNLSPHKADSAQNPQKTNLKSSRRKNSRISLQILLLVRLFPGLVIVFDILRVKVVFADFAGLGVVFRRSG